MRRAFALVAVFIFTLTAARAASDVSLLDLVETDLGYSTISEQYYQRVAPQRLLDGAQSGMIAYLRARGIAQPDIAVMHARADGRGAVPAIEQQMGRAILRYGSRIVVRDLVYAAIRGELAALHDPYSLFFTVADLKKFTTALDGTAFGGIGIVIAGDAQAKEWHVDQVFDDSPAAKAGVRQHDVIAAVDGTAIGDRTTDAITALLRGRVGSVVKLSIVRDGTPLPAPLTITRAAITPPAVTSRLLPGGVAYIALRTFDLTAGDDVRRALVRLRANGARATVFDLRGNGGGYESAAVHVASVFIASGPIVAVQERRGHRIVTNADGRALAPEPLAVLVDGNSASGSELVAGAIHDRGAGTLVGTTTYGKGLVQTIVPLPDGAAVKLTTARYFTAGGHDIDRRGIQPDVVVAQPPNATTGVPADDPQLARALSVVTPSGSTGATSSPSP